MSLPETVGVYGGGRMGGGIAHTLICAGATVCVVESSQHDAAAAQARIEQSLTIAQRRGTLATTVEQTLSRLSLSTDPSDLAGCGLVIEAVPEDLTLKSEILAAVEQIAPDAWLASNTSSLSITTLAAALTQPERFIGLHFFNPVPASDLVEIVYGPRTTAELVPLAQTWVRDLGKTAITVTDSPGFASSRLGVAIALEAMRMLQDGVASAEDIDTAMTLGYKRPIGPLRTSDIVGLDVRLAIAAHLAREIDSRFEPPAILRDKVAAHQLGRKTGQGFLHLAGGNHPMTTTEHSTDPLPLVANTDHSASPSTGKARSAACRRYWHAATSASVRSATSTPTPSS